MFSGIFLKTLYEKRWFTLSWFVGIIVMGLITMVFFPYFSNSGFDQVVNSMPKSLEGLLGDANAYKTVAGYADAQIFALRMPMLTLIMSITLFVGLSAGDESRGTLETLLAQPVSRARVFWAKFWAGALICAVGCIGIFVGVVLSFVFIDGSMSLTRLAAACFGCWLITLVFGALAYAVGTATGRRGVTIALASIVAFVSYLITSLAPAVSKLDFAQHFSMFYYYNTPSIISSGLQLRNTGVMLGAIVILTIGSLLLFKNRDIVRGD